MIALLRSRLFWYAIGIVVTTVIAFQKGYGMASRKCEAEKREALARQAELTAQIARQDNEVINWHMTRDKRRIDYFRSLRDEAETVPLPDCTVSSRGRELWNRANEGGRSIDTSDPYGVMQAPPPPWSGG